MNTEWHYPEAATQFAEHESHVAWDDSRNFAAVKRFDNNLLITKTDLIHYANPGTNDIRKKTWFLLLSEYNFSNITGQIIGVEVKLDAQRTGRVSDETMELSLNGKSISDNRATPALEMTTIYGGSTDLWGVGIIDAAEVQRPDFGIIMRFQSHPYWPHRSPMMINTAAIRIWTA